LLSSAGYKYSYLLTKLPSTQVLDIDKILDIITRAVKSSIRLALVAMCHSWASTCLRYWRGSTPFVLPFPSPPSSRDFVALIAGVQRIDGPLQVKYWGVVNHVTHAALTPMPRVIVSPHYSK